MYSRKDNKKQHVQGWFYIKLDKADSLQNLDMICFIYAVMNITNCPVCIFCNLPNWLTLTLKMEAVHTSETLELTYLPNYIHSIIIYMFSPPSVSKIQMTTTSNFLSYTYWLCSQSYLEFSHVMQSIS